jgi:hypothetical protein
LISSKIVFDDNYHVWHSFEMAQKCLAQGLGSRRPFCATRSVISLRRSDNSLHSQCNRSPVKTSLADAETMIEFAKQMYEANCGESMLRPTFGSPNSRAKRCALRAASTLAQSRVSPMQKSRVMAQREGEVSGLQFQCNFGPGSCYTSIRGSGR